MTDRPPATESTDRCPVCGEHIVAGVRECGTCGSPVGGDATSTVVVVTTLVLICTGTLLVMPGFGVLLSIGSIAPIIRLTMVVRRRTEKGLDTPQWQQWTMYLSSLWVTSIVLWTTGLAAFFAFCFSCLGVALATNGAFEPAIAFGALVALVVAVVLGRFFLVWIRGRWRTDIGETDDVEE